ncbi:MAG: hypothetical protein DMG98_15405 [Acidobacteria bacterium]|nr:MAG: hypothetical protein DMG98_15405 [Acidobacteriota bacterium]
MRVKKLALIFASISLATAVLIAASKRVTIKEFDVPTPKSRPHDPAVAPDGSLWYTGQAANKLGRLDPATQKFKEFPLKTPGSGPHGLVADSQGNIWFTAIAKGYIGSYSGFRPARNSVVHDGRIERCRSARSEDRQDRGEAGTDAARDFVRHRSHALWSTVLLRIRIE